MVIKIKMIRHKNGLYSVTARHNGRLLESEKATTRKSALKKRKAMRKGYRVRL